MHNKRIRWLQNTPIAYSTGYLYFCVRYNDRPPRYVRCRGKRTKYWLNLLLSTTSAVEVTQIDTN